MDRLRRFEQGSRRSITTTRYDGRSFSRFLTTCEAMKPAPPVTSSTLGMYAVVSLGDCVEASIRRFAGREGERGSAIKSGTRCWLMVAFLTLIITPEPVLCRVFTKFSDESEVGPKHQSANRKPQSAQHVALSETHNIEAMKVFVVFAAVMAIAMAMPADLADLNRAEASAWVSTVVHAVTLEPVPPLTCRPS